jgi:hypothetical protein
MMPGFGAAGRGFRSGVRAALRAAGVRRNGDADAGTVPATGARPAPGADAGGRLAARYRWLLRAYPLAYRTERGDEILDTYLDVAAHRPGPLRHWPLLADAVDLVAGGIRARLRARGSSGLADAVPLAATFALSAAVALAAVWLTTVEPRAVPAGIELRTLGPLQSLGAVAWAAWLLAGVSAVLLPGRVTRRLVAGAVAVTALQVPAAALTPFERPPLLVLVPQLALGLVALGWRTHATPLWERGSRAGRIAIAVTGTAAAATACAAADNGAALYGYRATGRDVMAFVALVLVGGAVVTAFVRAFSRDARGWWATLLVLPPATLLVVEYSVRVAGDATGLTTDAWWAYAVAAAVLTVLAGGSLPLATSLRSRWR